MTTKLRVFAERAEDRTFTGRWLWEMDLHGQPFAQGTSEEWDDALRDAHRLAAEMTP